MTICTGYKTQEQQSTFISNSLVWSNSAPGLKYYQTVQDAVLQDGRFILLAQSPGKEQFWQRATVVETFSQPMITDSRSRGVKHATSHLVEYVMGEVVSVQYIIDSMGKCRAGTSGVSVLSTQ